MEGECTNSLCLCGHIQVLSSEASELLPIYNTTVSKFYKTPAAVSDWSTPGHSIRNYTTKRYGK